MPHMLEVPITGFDSKGQHTHLCEYCEQDALCQDSFYLRHRDLGDVILCRNCCEDSKIQLVFRAIRKLLAMGSNITDDAGVYRYGVEIEKREKVIKK